MSNKTARVTFVIGIGMMIGGFALKKWGEKSVRKTTTIHAYHKAFDQQMKEYEFDTQRRIESIRFWQQIIGDELF